MSSQGEKFFFTVSKEEENQRIDRLLTQRFSDKSRTYFQYLLASGYVWINEVPVKKRESPKEGDRVAVFFEKTPAFSLDPEEINLDILYEDEDLIAINKPPGMVVHPAPGNWKGTFVNALLAHCKKLIGFSDSLRPGIVHRLDKDTSGVLLAAKTEKAQQQLVEAFKQRRVNKTYLAICLGTPPNGIIRQPISRDPIHRKRMSLSEKGKPAQTECFVLAYNEKISLVKLKPFSGRTHQLRVHMSFLRTPILGDDLYGNPSFNHALKALRPQLHAYQIQFSHPITQEPMHLMAPLPEDMKAWIQKLATS